MQQIRPSEATVGVERSTSGRIYYGWIVVAVCVVVLTLTSVVIDGFSLFYPPVLNEFGWPRGDTAVAMSIHLVVSGLASPFAGSFIDRFGPRLVMPLGALLTATGFLLLSQSTALWHFYIGFGLLAAMGSSMLYFTPLTTIVSNWFVRHRGTAIGLVGVGQGIGQVLLPMLQLMIDTLGWRGAYIVLATTIFVVPSLLALLFLRARPEDRGLSIEQERLPWRKKENHFAQEEEAGQGKRRELVIVDQAWAETEWTIRKAIKTSSFWLMMLVLGCYGIGVFVITVQLVVYLVDKGYTSVMAASVMSVQGIITMIGRFLGGVLCDRIGREKTLTLAVAAFLGSLVLLGVAGMHVNPVMLYSYGIVFGLSAGMSLPALMASTADLFEGKHFGSILGVIMLGGWTAAALGAGLSGYLYDLTQSYMLSFSVAALVMVLSAAFIWKARPGRVRVMKYVLDKR